MRIVVQRVRNASVTIEGEVVGQIGVGLLVLLGVRVGDTADDVEYLADKILGLRIFADDADRMNRSIADVKGAFLVVSQFTLYGDCRRGRRPSFVDAAPPDVAVPLYEQFVRRLSTSGLDVQTGRFGAQMDVALLNDGPVTLVLESRNGG